MPRDKTLSHEKVKKAIKEEFLEKGYQTIELGEEELHMLLSAYLTACFEPIIHDYDDKKE